MAVYSTWFCMMKIKINEIVTNQWFLSTYLKCLNLINNIQVSTEDIDNMLGRLVIFLNTIV